MALHYTTTIVDLALIDLIHCQGIDAFWHWINTMWKARHLHPPSLRDALDIDYTVVEGFTHNPGHGTIRLRLTAWYEDTDWYEDTL